MYNLFVANDAEAWDGEPWKEDVSRCLREYTNEQLTKSYGLFDEKAIIELKRLPCIFAYESHHDKQPKFGSITDIAYRHGEVRVSYQIIPVNPFLSAEQLSSLLFELDIRKWELSRTHWALKEVNLAKELIPLGITLPNIPGVAKPGIKITTHNFDVALSFPGEAREVVEPIAKELERRLGPDRYFYDANYKGALARPALDLLLQDIYGKRSKLIVVFVSGEYQTKNWCGIEFRAIREIINRRENARIMFIKTGEGEVEGIQGSDGYVDARKLSAEEIAGFIEERLGEL